METTKTRSDPPPHTCSTWGRNPTVMKWRGGAHGWEAQEIPSPPLVASVPTVGGRLRATPRQQKL